MEKFFKIEENLTSTKKEILGGITTFLTMAYIIAVNPGILSASGMPIGALVTATCLTAGLTTILMGLYANLPFGLAPGMGINAFFAFSVCKCMNIHWSAALTAVFCEGIIFIILTLTNVRESIVNAIPINLKLAVTAGIGLFITFIGFVNSGIVVKNDVTLVSMGNFVSPTVLITTLGLMVIIICSIKEIKGALLWGILVSAISAWIYAGFAPQAASFYNIGSFPKEIFKFESLSPIAFKLNFSFLNDGTKLWQFLVVVFTFLFVDFFDTLGTLVGVASKANMLDENGNVPSAGKALLVDAIGTTVGAMLGVSAVTTFVESSAGVAEGARTGLSSIVTGILFLIAMFFSPIFVAIPSCATAPALIIVGFFMISNISKINFNDFTEGIPAFLTIISMPLTYSIGDGLTIGILSYCLINLFNNIFTKDKKYKKKISLIMYGLSIVFIFKLIITGIS